MSGGAENLPAQQNDISASAKTSGLRFPNRNYNDDWTRTLDAFETLSTLGEGTFGWVQKARDKKNGEIVALKKIKMENETEGFPITAIREIKILKTLKDRLKTDHVVVLKEVVAAPERDMNSDDKGSIYLVFEYLEHDLAGLMDLRYDTMFRMESIKCFMKQLLEGLYALHHNKIIHRDIKASNLLVNNEGVLKIADFGLARPHLEEPWHYTANVITLWYRPPEVLLATEQNKKAVVYSTYVDMWSAGCILAEMLFRAPLFKGRTETELIDSIFRVLGTPTRQRNPELWPSPNTLQNASEQVENQDHSSNSMIHSSSIINSNQSSSQSSNPSLANSLANPSSNPSNASNTSSSSSSNPSSNTSSNPSNTRTPQKPKPTSYDIWRHWKEPSTLHPPKLKQMCEDRKLPPQTYELLSALLSYDPERRMSAKVALDNDWFWEEPLPCNPSEIGSCPPSNELLAKKHKEEERRKAAILQQNRGNHPNNSGHIPPHNPSNHGNHHAQPPSNHQSHAAQGHHPAQGHNHPNGQRGSSHHPSSGINHPSSHHPNTASGHPNNASSHPSAAKHGGISGFAGPAKPTSAMPKGGPPKYISGPPKYTPPPGAASAPRYPASGPPRQAGGGPAPPVKPPPPSSSSYGGATKPPHYSPTYGSGGSGGSNTSSGSAPRAPYQPLHQSPPSSTHHPTNPQHTNPHHTNPQQRAAPSSSVEGSAPHYPASSGFHHNESNTNKRYKTEETRPVNGSN